MEYRQKGISNSDALEEKILGSGLIVYRINTRVEELGNYKSELDGVYVFCPDETSVLGGSMMSLNNAYCSLELRRASIGSPELAGTIADGALVFSDGTTVANA